LLYSRWCGQVFSDATSQEEDNNQLMAPTVAGTNIADVLQAKPAKGCLQEAADSFHVKAAVEDLVVIWPSVIV